MIYRKFIFGDKRMGIESGLWAIPIVLLFIGLFFAQRDIKKLKEKVISLEQKLELKDKSV